MGTGIGVSQYLPDFRDIAQAYETGQRTATPSIFSSITQGLQQGLETGQQLRLNENNIAIQQQQQQLNQEKIFQAQQERERIRKGILSLEQQKLKAEIKKLEQSAILGPAMELLDLEKKNLTLKEGTLKLQSDRDQINAANIVLDQTATISQKAPEKQLEYASNILDGPDFRRLKVDSEAKAKSYAAGIYSALSPADKETFYKERKTDSFFNDILKNQEKQIAQDLYKGGLDDSKKKILGVINAGVDIDPEFAKQSKLRASVPLTTFVKKEQIKNEDYFGANAEDGMLRGYPGHTIWTFPGNKELILRSNDPGNSLIMGLKQPSKTDIYNSNLSDLIKTRRAENL